jgi:hypothetical protein
VRKAFGLLAGVDVEAVTVDEVNGMVRACLAAGAGMFTTALRAELNRRGRDVPYLAHDLVAELDGASGRGDEGVLWRLGLN